MSKTVAWRIVPAVAAVLLVSALVVQASIAAFSDTTDTQGGEWTSGSVMLTNDGGTVASFTPETNMVPGDSDQACITVTYDGTVASEIRMYGSTAFNSDSDLGEYLDLTIEELPDGTTDCAGADADTVVYDSGTLSAFATAHSQWSDANQSVMWTPSGNDTQIFRITVTLQNNDSAQGLDTTGTFTWEAQST